jgi:hypothetical protein
MKFILLTNEANKPVRVSVAEIVYFLPGSVGTLLVMKNGFYLEVLESPAFVHELIRECV